MGDDLTLPPSSTNPGTALDLTGTIVRNDDPNRLAALGRLFSRFLAGELVPLTVTGNEVVSPAQPGRPVSWLSAGFKQLVLNVTLPG